MLKSFIKHRPRHVLAVYVEPQQIEIVRAQRHWRTWQVDSAEHFPIPDGDNVYDFLQRLNLRPRGYKGTALVLFLSRTYYSFHREHYPVSLQDHLYEALAYDWQENIFYDHDQTLHFFGTPVPVDGHLSVPIFTLQQNVYEKFQQVLGAGGFQTFAVIPSALTYESFFPNLSSEPDSHPLEIIGRVLDATRMEIHRFYRGRLLDSIVVGRKLDNLRLFRESLRCIENGQCQENLHIHLICTDGECAEDYEERWAEENLSVRAHSIQGSLLSHWIRHLFDKENIQTFDNALLLKPWKVPKVAWAIAALVLFFAMYAAYEVYSLNNLLETSRSLKKQTAALETQWKPIEQLQTRISKFQEDQKTLTQFNSQGYPLFEILTMLTQLTPDDTWLNYLSLRSGQLMLRGESKSAIKYLSELSKVEGMNDVRFASPVTRNPASDQERFNVQVQIDPEKLNKYLATLPSSDEAGDSEGDLQEPEEAIEEAPSEAVSSTEEVQQQSASPRMPGPRKAPRRNR